MPDLDLVATQEEIGNLLRRIKRRLGGLNNTLCFEDLDEQEKATVQTVIGQYEEWQRVLQIGVGFVVDMIMLGYPVLPLQSVPLSMLKRLDTEMDETQDARTVFVAEILATRANVTVSPAEKK